MAYCNHCMCSPQNVQFFGPDLDWPDVDWMTNVLFFTPDRLD